MIDLRGDMVRQTAGAMTKGLDARISERLNELEPGWTLETVSGRLGSVRYEDDGPDGPETLTLDGKPFLRIWPLKITTEEKGDSYVTRVTQNYQRLAG